MKSFFSVHWALVAAIWYFVNGVLHDIFVVIRHKGKYDRDLLRLLLDGHVLMLSGAVACIAYLMLQKGMIYGSYMNLLVGFSMLVYCALIFPFLKSFVTMAISIGLIAGSIQAIWFV